MKTLLALTALVATAATTPALAQSAPANANFVGPRVEVTAGLDDVTKYRDPSQINYGFAGGIDAPLGNRFTIGAEGNVANFADYKDYGAAARIGVAVTPHLLAYGAAGYAKFQGLDGLRVGGGLELSTGHSLYAKVEYRYSDFQHGVGRHQGLVGVGLRF